MNINENQKAPLIASLLIYVLLIVGIPVARASVNSDGSTVTTVEKTLDPLDQYRGATELSATELKDLLHLVGFEGKSLRLAWSIVMKESRGHPLSHNKNRSTGDNSYGLFQINMLGSLGEIRKDKFGIKENSELLDPVTNAQAAYYMSAHGTDFGSWGLGSNAYDGSAAEPEVTRWLSEFPK